MAVETVTINPDAARAARAGEQPYPGQDAPKDPTQPLQTVEHPVAKGEPFIPGLSDKKATPAEAAPAPADDSAPADETEAAPADEAAASDPQAVAEAAGLNYEALYTEWKDNGTLSPESLTTIKAAFPGVPDEIIGTYLAGLGAINVLAIQNAHNIVGGTEKYNAMIGWAAQALPENEAMAFNTALDAGDASAAQAIKGMWARFQGAQGGPAEPDLSIVGTRASGEPPIKSRQELMHLIRDPRFAKDPAYREKVEKMAAEASRHPDYRTYYVHFPHHPTPRVAAVHPRS